MDDPGTPRAPERDGRADRLAEALRANLRRRKDQQRARADGAAAGPSPAAVPPDAAGPAPDAARPAAVPRDG
jgi:hypothetical protein